MWRLLHTLFGYDYVQWKNFADSGIARVHVGGNGEIFYWRYKSTCVIDRIKNAEQVVWLTCQPSKYLDMPTKQE